MQKTMYIYLGLLLLSVIHIQSSCVNRGGEFPEPKPKELPAITTEGRNTIGFLLNGEVWLPRGGAIGNPDKDFVLDTTYGDSYHFGIGASYKDLLQENKQQRIFIRISLNGKYCDTGLYEINRQQSAIYFIDYELIECSHFRNIRKGEVLILFCDLDKQIISGTFEMEIENDCGDIYSITEGRFDSNFRYY